MTMAAVESSSAPPASPPRKSGPFTSLRNRDFRWLWISTVSAGFGQWGQQIALNWLVYVMTGSAVQLGAVTFAGGLISLFLTPFAGLLADRYSRRTIMVVSMFAGAAQAAVIAVLVLTGLVQVWHAYLFAVLAALAQAANQPARQAYVNDASTPETLANAIALNSIAQNVSRIVGPPLAGIIAVWNVGAAFLFVAAIKGFATLATMLLSDRPQARATTTRNPVLQIADGFAYLLREPRLRLLLLINAAPALLIYPYMSFMPIFAEEVFDADWAYGWLVAMIAVGSVVGLFALAWVGDIRRKPQIMLACFMAYLVLVVAFTRVDLLAAGLAILIVAGVFHGVALALNNTVFQTEVRADMRGRGLAAWQIGFGLMPLGGLPMGLMVDRFGIQDGVALEMLLCIVIFAGIVIFGRSLTRSE
ncbi:MAG: MFS transporter [Dehalococcoidia bacterium]